MKNMRYYKLLMILSLTLIAACSNTPNQEYMAMTNTQNTEFKKLVSRFNASKANGLFVEMQYQLNLIVRKIETKQDYLDFLDLILDNYNTLSTGWENQNLFSFLEALHAFSDSVEGYYKHEGIDAEKEPKWRMYGELLLGATNYE